MILGLQEVLCFDLRHQPRQNLLGLAVLRVWSEKVGGGQPLELFTALVYYFECCDQRTLDVLYTECAMTDVVGIVERVKDDEWVLEWASSRIFAEYYVVAV